MNQEQQYLDLLKNILHEGTIKQDRTGVGTKSIFGSSLKFSLEGGTLPLLTTKKVFTKGIIEELLFFIRGERNTKLLEAKGVNIWKGNTTREFLDKRGLSHYKEGDMGPMYGVQWRNFGAETESPHIATGIDQLSNAFNLIKNDPTSRRIVVTAYNPVEDKLGVLSPCHMFFQFNVNPDDTLDCLFYMRSVDSFLGLPFNITSYAILTHMMAKATGLKPGHLVFNGGDTHLYLNHIEQAKEQISRAPFVFPKLNIKKNISSIKDMEQMALEDFEIIGYQSHPAIKAEMAV